MSKTFRIPNGFITLVETTFKCPNCSEVHSESDYYSRLNKSKNGLIYMQCKGCKVKLGITTDMMGDVKVWLKKDETKISNIKLCPK